MVDKVTEAAVVGGVDTHKDLHVAAVVDQNKGSDAQWNENSR
ncbi:hypothetical protein [Enterobacter asburiae]|nr:hypothetical protein [Enterobacter asburiae]